LDLLHFTTESYAEVDRVRAWSEALDRHGLRCGVPQSAARPLHGTIKSRKSTSGFELIALSAFAQTIELKVDGADSLVIVLHLDGGVTLVADGVRARVATGDIIYASSREEARLSFTSDFRAFVIRVPRSSINARLLTPFSLRAGRLLPGALLSIGDPHASQGDSELCGTAIECSLTGDFQLVVHKKETLSGEPFADLTYPLVETADEWVLHGFSYPNYLAEFGTSAQSAVYESSTLDLAMRDAFIKTRRFLMTTKGLSEDEAISLISVAVDFGVTQVVDGNWGVHAIIRKALFDA
jgi:hypothetical protein